MVSTGDRRRSGSDDGQDWIRPLVIVLFFVLVALVATSRAAETGTPAPSAQMHGIPAAR